MLKLLQVCSRLSIEQSEVLETSIEDLEQAYLRLSKPCGEEVEVVNLDSAPLPSKSPLSDYEKSVEEKEWYKQEVLKPLAIAICAAEGCKRKT